MLNQCVLVGRLFEDPIIEEENTSFILAVPNHEKNKDGEYDTDFIKCLVSKKISNAISEYCEKGSVIGVRGRLKTVAGENNNYYVEVMAEKVTFLSAKSKEIGDIDEC